MTVVNVRGSSYHIDDKLIKVWDNLKNGKLAQYDEDRFYIVDGSEGAGKSLFAIQQGAYIDPTILDDEDGKLLPRICFRIEEFLYAIRHTKSDAKNTKVIIFDEAFRGFSSKSALSKVNKSLTQALMEARQNNLIVFLISPSFYYLEFYAAVLRSTSLFHVVKEKKKRTRYVRIFNKKKKGDLYTIGVRKGFGYPVHTKTRARFFNIYPGGDEFENRYRHKKDLSFKDTDKKEEPKHKWKTDRDNALRLIHSLGYTYQQMSEMLKEHGTNLSFGQIGKILRDEEEE